MKKLCKDCKYYKKYYGYGSSTGIYDECLCPMVIKEEDVVRGDVYINFCNSARFPLSKCGPDAKYFEQYEPPVNVPWWTKKLRKTKKLVRITTMGMFDYFRSAYDLGEQFTEVVCQTKDIEEFGIGGSMTDYWLDPAGRLWCPHYRDTHTFEVIEENDDRYSTTHAFFNFEWIPTGKHGVYKPHEITKYVEIHLAEWKGNWEDWPRLRLHFRCGILQEYTAITRV